ncbi:MAG: hypothetical protein ACNA7E_11220, partial [Wenzhouxiangellaceae bacterium]
VLGRCRGRGFAFTAAQATHARPSRALLLHADLALGILAGMRRRHRTTGGQRRKQYGLPALALVWLFDTWADIAREAVLEAAMPPMITAAALLSGARLAPPLAAALVVWGVLFSAATVPLWFWLGRFLLQA